MQMLSNRIPRWAAVVVLPLLATAAQASFHLFVIDQIYSDASGVVQYVELSTPATGQQFLAGNSITASQGTSSHTFTFPTNLPGDTANKKFLVATQGFANLPGVVTPDYTVPSGFLFQPGGTINFASVDSVTYAALPTDGVTAINHSGTPVPNTPTNFAGGTSSVNIPPPAQAGPMDVDQNGQVDALTDGLMLLRYMFGLRGAALIQGALGSGAARNTAALIEAYLATCIAGPGATCVIP